MPSEILTSRQRIVRFIRDFAGTYGYPPTTQEIAQGLGFGSGEAVRYHLRALRALGGIEWTEGGGRTVRLKEVDVDDDSSAPQLLEKIEQLKAQVKQLLAAPSGHPADFSELADFWPSLKDLPDGVDILGEKFGKPTGAESHR